METASSPSMPQNSPFPQPSPQSSGLLHPNYVPGPATFSLPGYEPELDYAKDVSRAWKEFEKNELYKETDIYTLRCSRKWSDSQDTRLNDKLLNYIIKKNEKLAFELFSISRYLVKNQEPLPPEPKKLRITSKGLRSLLSKYDIPSAFTSAVCRHYQTCGTGLRERIDIKSSGSVWEYWCLIPVRVQVRCKDDAHVHAKSTAGSNQMDPFHYIHLPDSHVDVRGSRIALFTRHDCGTGSTFVLVINFSDGRWFDIIEEPLKRIEDTINSRGSGIAHAEPAFVHLIFLSGVIRWWNNVLLSFNQQLIECEKKLQEVMDMSDDNSTNIYAELNKSLHVMAAHLHRYSSELGQLEGILLELQEQHKKSRPAVNDKDVPGDNTANGIDLLDDMDKRSTIDERKSGCESIEEWRRARNGFAQLLSQLRAVSISGRELESKIQNIVALLFNNSTHQEAKISRTVAMQSYELTQKMGEDSIAMKTIAILTMFFLPGTSYAVG
ncbi:hypothetical protein CC78DRAFT_216414 [Lojkania enalia]|uniref:Uncharacterized protein n=1 Tax=Lojkania enalia TaxID=147567 RepID=A0A9P4KAC0_9PLEO|nr:hypothetical protein CC78DRAFT_216414 [Didymosphaeria enalia]